MITKIAPGIAVCVASFLHTASVYNQLPERVASHWAFDGTPNGWMSRIAFVLFAPVLATFLSSVLVLAPNFDSRKGGFESHAASYWIVVNATLVFLAVGNIIVTGVNIGRNFRVEWLGFCLGVYLITLGNVLTRVRPNGIFGVRTPWTLTSERSWRATQRVAGYGVVLVGLATLAAMAMQPRSLAVVLLGGLISVAAISIVYSYLIARADNSLS